MQLTRKQFLGSMVGAAAAIAAPRAFSQSTVTLRLHQFLPPQAPIPRDAIGNWVKKVQEESKGRIRIQQFPSMQLGGRPPELFDQAKNGVVDIAWTVLGYTPGRFPKTEVFELPFFTGKAVHSSAAIYDYIQQHAADEFQDVKLLAAHTHGAGLFHSKTPITKLEEIKGKKVRGGSRIINIMLEQLGAVPVGMPVPQVGEALSKGVIEVATLPWEVAPSLRIPQLVKNHTGFSGPHGLYTQTFALVMNPAKYNSLPDDLKAVIDANSGLELSKAFGQVLDDADVTGLKMAQDAKNNIITLDEAETKRWQDAAASTRESWFTEVKGRGIDGAKLASEAERLVAQYSVS
ncbi:TRAP transporter substrate-binding protein [Lampropedia puyangensis]|uniref:TRAP transporter substrate-binding protein n=1 Tax=Lampropedia puyangensis TaxID=1330072 RepID=A0A4S8ET90_9BURK|nr:TRAP transporter substrate-binding protein [Lampropedia puyangensis]THT97588.1 TRAP transporter substrate-binding protein [Lampropedia puyangensis]